MGLSPEIAAHPLVPVVRYLVSEEERLGIWSAFRIRESESDSAGPPVAPGRVIKRPLDQGWVFAVDPDNEGLKKAMV